MVAGGLDPPVAVALRRRPARGRRGRRRSPGDEPDPAVLAVAAAVLGEVRKAKSEAKRSMRADVAVATVTDTAPRLALLALAESDVRSAGRIAELRTVVGETLAVEVELVPET